MSYESDKARLAQLNEYLGITPKMAEPPPAVPGSLWGRTGQQAANLPSNIVEDMMTGFQGAFNLLTPKGGEVPLTDVPKPYDIAAPTSFGEAAVDVGAGIASLLPAALAPEIAVARGAQVFGMGQRAARLLGSGVGWGLTGTPMGGEEAAAQAGLGVLGTATDRTPMRARVPLALLSGAAGYAYGAQHSQTEGAIMGGLNTILPFAEPVLHAAINKVRAANVAEAAADGAKVTSAPPTPTSVPGMNLTGGINALGGHTYGQTGLDIHDAFRELPRPTRPLPFTPSPDVPAPIDPLRLGTGPVPEAGGIPFFEPPSPNGQLNLVVGQRGIETPGWEQGAIPLSPSGLATERSLPHQMGMLGSPEGNYGNELQSHDAFRRDGPPESNGIAPAPEVATLQTEAKPHFQEKFKPKVQALLKDSGFGAPREMPAQGQEQAAHALGAKLKTQAEVNQLKNASKSLEKEMDAALEAGDMDLATEIAMKGQFLNEAIEFAEGSPGKLNTYLSRDTNYKPSVPGKEYIAAQGGPAAKPPKKGTNFAVKNEGILGMGTVTKVSKGNVHYQIENPITGETTHHVSSAEEFATLQKSGKYPQASEATAPPPVEANPSKPVEPAAQPAPQPKSPSPSLSVRVQTREGWVEAKVLSHQGDTVRVEIDDPIRGLRQETVLASETRPSAASVVTPETPKGGVPFQDVAGAKTIKTRSAGEFDGIDDILADRDTPAYVRGEDGEKIPFHEIPSFDDDTESIAAYLQRYKSQTMAQAARELEGLGGMLLKDMMKRMLKASGQESFPVRFVTDEAAWQRIGRLSVAAGRIELTWDYVQRILKDWRSMDAGKQASSILKITKLLGHELGHAAIHHSSVVKNLQINGRSLVDAIEHEVMTLPLQARQFIASEVKEAVGEGGIVNNYLAGDIETVWKHYKQGNPSLTRQQASKMAAEEFMVELMAVELHKRMQTKGLTGVMRAAIDRLKNVFMGVLRFFSKTESNVAALQNLQNIAIKSLDQFGEATVEDFAKAFPSSAYWSGQAAKAAPAGRLAKTVAQHVEPTNPLDWIVMDFDSTGTPPAPHTSDSFLQSELLRIGVRTVGGAIAGHLVAPTITRDQVTSAEGALLGGLMGAFGPAFARHLLNSDLATEAGRALVAGKGNPIKSLEALLQGKSLRQLGGEALFTTKNGVARFVRGLEISLGINFDPKLRAVLENSRGLASKQLSMVYDAMKAAKDYKPSAGLEFATLQFLTGKLDHGSFIKMLGTPDEKAYGTLITTARAGVDVLQDMFASGMKESAFKATVQASMGEYLGKYYTAYTKGEFDMTKFADAKADLKKAFHDYSDDVADAIMHQHMREVQADRKLFGRVSNTGQQMDPALWKRRLSTESEIEAQEAIVAGLPYGDADYTAATEKLAYMRKHKITEGWASWLGEVKDPKERVLRTFQKLYASSMSGKTFDLLTLNVDQFGNRFVYGAEELSKVTEAGAARLKVLDPTSPEFATLQTQMDELKYYVPLPSGAQFGKLSGKMVSRFVRDEIATDTSPFKWMEQPIFRGISEFNNAIKIGRTALNPITVIRNYFQMPMFGLIAKTNMTDLVQGWKEIRGRTDLHHLMLEHGITNADFTAAELTDGPGRLFSGFFDSDSATRMAAKGFHTAMEVYRAPDMVLRAGTFISAMRRFSDGDLAKGLKDPSIINRAVEFTNRYTMNYHAVSKIIKVGRQLPFVSLFLSYTTEITRILKNLVSDAVSPTADSAGRMHALMVLGGMAAIPALMVTTAEAALSSADKKEWDKVKALSPSYSRLRFRIPIGKRDGSFHYMDFTNLLPADAYTMMVRGIAAGDYEAAAAVNPVLNLENTPLLNIASEQISGKDSHTGKSLQGLDRVRQVLKEVLPPITPGVGYEASRIANAFTPNATGSLGLTNVRTGRSILPSDIIANYLTGMKFGDVNPTAIQRGFIADAKQQIAEQQQLLRQTTATNANEAVRKAAIERFNTAVKEIMFGMHEKLALGN